MADLTPAEFAELWRLKPEGAMRYMQSRQGLVRTFNWQDMIADEHVRNFTVSRLTALDVLTDVRDAVTRSVGGDLTRRDFILETRRTLQSKGWWGVRDVLDEATGEMVQTEFNPRRLQLIYDTNTRMAHAAGQWERIQRNKRLFPYLRYVTMADDDVRPAHARWHNVTLPVDDPFWQTRYPPNGWRCRCRVVGVSQGEYEVGTTPTGGQMRKTAPSDTVRQWVNGRTGEVREIPAGVAPGFDYNVGQTHLEQTGQMLLGKAITAEPRLAAVAIAHALDNPQMLDIIGEDFADFAGGWLRKLATARQTGESLRITNELRHIGALSLGVLERLASVNITPASAIISVSARDVVHTFRDSKSDQLPQEWYLKLPEHLRSPQAVLLDARKPDLPAVLLVYPAPLPDVPGQAHKLVVQLNYKAKDGRDRLLTNIVTSGRIELASGLMGLQVLEGRL